MCIGCRVRNTKITEVSHTLEVLYLGLPRFLPHCLRSRDTKTCLPTCLPACLDGLSHVVSLRLPSETRLDELVRLARSMTPVHPTLLACKWDPIRVSEFEHRHRLRSSRPIYLITTYALHVCTGYVRGGVVVIIVKESVS